MSQYKLTKKIAKVITELAKKLPPDYYMLERTERVRGYVLLKEGTTKVGGKPVNFDAMYKRPAIVDVSGKELIEKGVKKVDGKEVEAEKSYKKVVRDPYPINHERRLRKVYEEGGEQAIDHYFAKYGFMRKPAEDVK